MVRVKSPQDLGAGVVFLLIGIAGIYFGSDLAFGTAARMGPGYFPILLSGLIIVVGLVVGFKGLTIEGPPIEPVQLRPISFIIAAILIFGFLIERIGLALTADPADDLRRLCPARGQAERDDPARRRPGGVHGRGVRLRARAGAARLVGPLGWNSICSRTWRPASARRSR